MMQLRPHLAEETFVSQVRRQEKSGYRLALLQDQEKTQATAGFRLSESSFWGESCVYIDRQQLC